MWFKRFFSPSLHPLRPRSSSPSTYLTALLRPYPDSSLGCWVIACMCMYVHVCAYIYTCMCMYSCMACSFVRSFKYSPETTGPSSGRQLGPSPTTRKTLARARAAVGASHAQVPCTRQKAQKVVISEGGGEAILAGRDVVLCGVESTRNHQVHSSR
jgi:hypothetical protein